MKVYVLILTLLSFATALDTSKILQQLDSITNKQKNELLNSEIDNSYNPFDPAKIGAVEEKKSSDNNETIVTTPTHEPTRLQAIFDKNRVKIDGRWYESNQSVGEYNIEDIDQNSVVLKNGDKIIKLFIFEENILKVK